MEVPRQRQVFTAVDVHDGEGHLIIPILTFVDTKNPAVRLDVLTVVREAQNELDDRVQWKRLLHVEAQASFTDIERQKLQRPVLQGAELPLHLNVNSSVRAAVGVIELSLVLSPGLGDIHGPIGTANEIIGRQGVCRVRRDPKADGHPAGRVGR